MGNEMEEKIMLVGNLCSCSHIWFTLNLPESEPSRCPFCGKDLTKEELPDYESSTMVDDDRSMVTDDIQNKIDNINATDGEDLDIKTCNFCSNDIFISADDSENAVHCPYCDDGLLLYPDTPVGVDSDKISELLQIIEELANSASMSELVGHQVIIKKTRANSKPIDCVFGGVDRDTSFLSIQHPDGTKEWMPLTEVKSIRTLPEQD